MTTEGLPTGCCELETQNILDSFGPDDVPFISVGLLRLKFESVASGVEACRRALMG
jgi:hypothetical protein